MKIIKLKNNVLLLATLCIPLLTGCSGAKETLGLARQSPDEFSVVKRAPLAMPPNYKLQSPRPGARRPQEQSPVLEARKTTFGQSHQEIKEASAAEVIILGKAGAAQAATDIRATVDHESSIISSDKEISVAERLLGIGSSDGLPPSTIVDAEKEAERLRKNQEEGKNIMEGETPTIEK